MTGTIPDLPHGCGSWVIVNNTGAPLAFTVGGRPLTAAPGGAIVETFDRETAERCAARGLGVVTALQWQQSLNNRPLAAPGLVSYRCRSPYGWIMIGATDTVGALREAGRSTAFPHVEDLQVWDGAQYVAVVAEESKP